MYNLIKTKSTAYLAKETPALISAAVIAEFFYKFGSFTLELIAFFFTWYAISRVISFFSPNKS